MTSEFPFAWIPILVLIQAFPNCSENFGFSSREIVTELSTDYKRDCKVDIGSYVEASTDKSVTNDNAERTTSCVALGPVGNRQCSVECFNAVSQLTWPLDLGNRLVKKVEAWSKNGARAIKKGCTVCLGSTNKLCLGQRLKHVNALETT